MNLILKTKYTLSTEFVLAQVRGNNHWRTSQVRLEILNDRTLLQHAAENNVIINSRKTQERTVIDFLANFQCSFFG
jgi:hypothetical protein